MMYSEEAHHVDCVSGSVEPLALLLEGEEQSEVGQPRMGTDLVVEYL